MHADTKTEVTKESGEKTSKGASVKAFMKSSEYGNVVYRDTISDETNGTDITWTVYDSGKLVIDGTGVTPDWSPWFYYKEDITDVIIGDGITALGERNFMNYPELKTVTVQGNLSKIGNSAFEGCKKLKNITVEGATNGAGLKVLMLGQCAFKDCTGLENAEFTGNFVTYKNAFEGCKNIRTITLNNSFGKKINFCNKSFRLGNKKKCRVSIISSKKLKKDTVKKLKKAGLKKFTTN